jgi:hypothetical protein
MLFTSRKGHVMADTIVSQAEGERISKAEAKFRDLSKMEETTSTDLYQRAIEFNAAQGEAVPGAQAALKIAAVNYARVALAQDKIRARVTKMKAKRLDKAQRMLAQLRAEAAKLGIEIKVA